MANTNRAKMPRAERAKQFMPFAALKGFEECLKAKEKITVEKREFSEEFARVLDLKMHCIRKNDVVTVVYFSKGEYLKRTGMVARVDESARILQIVNTKIGFEDIYDVEGEHIQVEI